MQISADESLLFIKSFIDDANSWADVEKQIKEHNLKSVLRGEDYVLLHNWWHEKQSSLMNEYQLASNLEFWAKGGTFQTHLDGFFAVPFNILLQEAKSRNWNIKKVGEGLIISPPQLSPIWVRAFNE